MSLLFNSVIFIISPDEKMDALPMPDDPLGAPLLSSTTYMPFTPQNVPEGATFNLTCDIPKGAEFKGWFLKKDDMVFTLDNYEYADHMKVGGLLNLFLVA